MTSIATSSPRSNPCLSNDKRFDADASEPAQSNQAKAAPAQRHAPIARAHSARPQSARAHSARAQSARAQHSSAARAHASSTHAASTHAARGLSHAARAEEGISEEAIEKACKALGVTRSSTPFPGSHLYTPGDGKPHPAIILLHGSEGGDAGYSDMQAIALAKQGFTVLAFDYFGKSEGLPHKLANVDIHRAVDAAHWLAKTPDVDGKKIGLFGTSRGAEQALLLASLEKDDKTFAAVAAHAPHATVVGSYDGATGGPVIGPDGRPQPAWLVDGKAPRGPIPIEKYPGPVFLSHGMRDDLWDVGQTRAIEKRLERNGKHAEVHLYPGEGHVYSMRAAIEEQKALVEFFRRTLGT